MTPKKTPPKAKAKAARGPMGPTLKANLIRLGEIGLVVPTTSIAKRIKAAGGRTISRQRITALFNAVHIEDDTIAVIAKGLGVKPEELTREVPRREVVDGLDGAIDEDEILRRRQWPDAGDPPRKKP
jgi:hypothetical protein